LLKADLKASISSDTGAMWVSGGYVRQLLKREDDCRSLQQGLKALPRINARASTEVIQSARTSIDVIQIGTPEADALSQKRTSSRL